LPGLVGDLPRDLVVRRAIPATTLTRISARLCAGSGLEQRLLRGVDRAPGLRGAALRDAPTTSPEYGERTSIQSPVSIQSPATKSFRSATVVATAQV
jgi:hypothetical protein